MLDIIIINYTLMVQQLYVLYTQLGIQAPGREQMMFILPSINKDSHWLFLALFRIFHTRNCVEVLNVLSALGRHYSGLGSAACVTQVLVPQQHWTLSRQEPEFSVRQNRVLGRFYSSYWESFS